jgi:hypothetical protein
MQEAANLTDFIKKRPGKKTVLFQRVKGDS